MGFYISGLGGAVVGASVSISFTDDHFLVKLADNLPWKSFAAIVAEDLMGTCPKDWRRGRKLQLCIHLCVFFLQKMFDFTDRQTEEFMSPFSPENKARVLKRLSAN